MQLIQLYLNSQLAELSESVKIQLDKIVSEYRNPTKKTGTASMPFTLPYTNSNQIIFSNEQDRAVYGKFKGVYKAQLVIDGETLIDGEFLLLKIIPSKGFEGAVGTVKITNPTIGDMVLDKKLVDIKSFHKIDFNGNDTVVGSWNSVVAYPDAEVCYPYVIPSFSHLTTGFKSSYENLGVSHFMPAIVKNIFKDAGYIVEGDIFSSVIFNKLFILYSNSDAQKWNYGKLNPMNAGSPVYGMLGGAYAASIIKTVERSTDTIYVVAYPFQANAGDLSESLGGDGVYTCKFSGLYNWTVRGEAVFQVGGAAVSSTGFTAFRCITDNEIIPENSIPSSSQFATLTTEYLDNGTIAVGGATDFSFTARMEEGKQYQLQRYLSVPTSTVNGGSVLAYANTTGKFNITSCDGPLLLNPALFLPNMPQIELLNTVFKLFNLFYQVNETEKVITFITRDNYFQEYTESIVDMSSYLNILQMEETPFSTKETDQTYVAFETDDSDYILKETNYLALVNGLQPEGATKIPFAPLGFIQVTYNAGTYSSPILGHDLLPAIFPDTSSEDTSVLSDEESVSSSSRTPRLALYNGTGWLKPSLESSLNFSGNHIQVALGRYTPGTPNYIGGFTPGYYAAQGFPPKLSFFDYAKQPVYKILTNTALRSFSLVVSTDDTIYKTANTDFLLDTTIIPEVNLISLAPNTDETVNPKGFFYGLYANDLLIGSLSNYLEGRGRITPTLFSQLTGRQVLRVNEDLYLLESIKAFDVQTDLATFKIYKLLSNTGATTTSAVRFTSTQSYTATCATGSNGTPSTKVATRTSYVSQVAADAAALAAAQADAEFYLSCTPDVVAYTSTKTAIADCPSGYHGTQTTGTGTYTSAISQADADTQAMALAVADADSKLSCEVDDNGG